MLVSHTFFYVQAQRFRRTCRTCRPGARFQCQHTPVRTTLGSVGLALWMEHVDTWILVGCRSWGIFAGQTLDAWSSARCLRCFPPVSGGDMPTASSWKASLPARVGSPCSPKSCSMPVRNYERHPQSYSSHGGLKEPTNPPCQHLKMP